MKKFVFLYQGNAQEDQGSMEDWMVWFNSIGDKFVDHGNPFGIAKEVTSTGTRELSPVLAGATGYSIVNAESFDEVELILKGCPMASNVRVYEALPM